MIPGLLLAAHETWQARYHSGHGGYYHAWLNYVRSNPGRAVLVGLGICAVAALLGSWSGKSAMGKLAHAGLWLTAAVVLVFALPIMSDHIQF